MIMLAASSSSTSVLDQPGTLGFLVVFGMAVIMYFVFRSMTRHLRKVNDTARAEVAKADADAARAESRHAGNGAPPAG